MPFVLSVELIGCVQAEPLLREGRATQPAPRSAKATQEETVAASKSKPKKKSAANRKPAEPSWTIRGVSEATKLAVTHAAKEKGVTIGQWVDAALSEAAQPGPGDQLMSSLQDMKSRAEPTLDELRSKTDETLEKWRAGLAEHVGRAVESIQRLQHQLMGQEETADQTRRTADDSNKDASTKLIEGKVVSRKVAAAKTSAASCDAAKAVPAKKKARSSSRKSTAKRTSKVSRASAKRS